MQLHTLTSQLPVRLVRGQASLTVLDVTDDSRRVTPGALFIARTGLAEDGAKYVQDALARGAVAVLAASPPSSQLAATLDAGVAWLTADVVDQSLAGRVAEAFFDYPSRKLDLVGVTGTNGKTTTAFIIQYLLQQADVRCGLIGTVIIDDGKQRHTADLTTPGAIDMSRWLARMAANGCRADVAEMSSHALHQGRVAGLRIRAGVYTNLTGDHLDYHRDMDDYADAKAKLFAQLGSESWAIVNADCAYADRVTNHGQAQRITCTLKDTAEVNAHRCRARILELGADFSRASFDGPWDNVSVRLPLVGRHNVINTLEAIAAVHALKPMSREWIEALAHCPPVPGRLERVPIPKGVPGGPTVIVDYAHTHDALENVLRALRPVTRSRLVAVIGCGGDRDKTKRPKMARVACDLADRVVITSDNPRTEDPQAIIADMTVGIPGGRHDIVSIEIDRAKAIAQAVAQAADDDLVLIAGKGHEDYQIIGREKRHFDDREQAAEALRHRAGQTV